MAGPSWQMGLPGQADIMRASHSLLCSFQRPPGVVLVTHNTTQPGTASELTRGLLTHVMCCTTAGSAIYNSSPEQVAAKVSTSTAHRSELQRSMLLRPRLSHAALPVRAPPPSHPRRLFVKMAQWDALVDAALARLAARSLLRATRPIALAPPPVALRTFPGPGPWDRAAVEIRLDRATLQEWLAEGGEASVNSEESDGNLILFSGNDYIGLSSHPAIREAAVTVCQNCLCGFSANMAVMTALGSISSLLAVGRKPAEDERIAIFSDALNHASIIDGLRLVERQQEAVVFVYKHCDMSHLDSLLSSCSLDKKVVVTDRQVNGILSAY
ncbi:hypothetical protein PR202_ga07829 [Eleusine coracana subsp. coracana]|uniref:8-amino-7-oxononanoate synthase n=1 Tax=Eleusine coracana subsp. coracana TaxID=191504 RepID=A0AAV5BZR0_ELECO|nr:hypothetical protein PR202_ga07829 [Eleusine coracana subsp. coracana]